MKNTVTILSVLLIISSCTSKNCGDTLITTEPPSPDLTFVEWANTLPYHLGGDTLFSNTIQNEIKECDTTYLPSDSEMIGRWFADGIDDQMWFYLLLIYKEGNEQIPYLEVYDPNGKREFSKRLFDHHLIKQDSTNFGRAYRYRLERHITFETYQMVNGQIKVIKSEKYNMSKMMRKYST